MENKSLFVIIFIFVLMLLSCSKEKVKTFEFEFVRDIELELESSFYNQPQEFKFFKKDSTLYYAYFSKQHLFLYDLYQEKQIADILIPNAQYVKIHNYDSVFVLLKTRNFVYDSTLFLMDFKGKSKKFYSVKGAPVFSVENSYRNEDSVAYISDIYYSENKLFLFFNKLFYEYINDSAYNSVNIPISGHIELAENKFYTHEIYDYPDLDKNKKYHYSNAKVNPFYKDNILYCNFIYTPKIIRYNITNKTSDIISAESFLTDNIILTKSSEVYENGSAYGFLSFLSKQKLFIKECLLDVDESNLKRSGIILESDFKKLGEFVFPNDIYITSDNVIGDKIYAYNITKTFSVNKKIILSEYLLKEKEVLLSIFMKEQESIEKATDKECEIQSKEESFIDKDYLEIYLNDLIGKENYKVIVLPVFMSCHSCVDYLLKMFNMNGSFYQKNNVYLIAVGNNFPAMKEKLKQFNIHYDTPNVILDSTSNYKKAFKNSSLEHLIIFEEKKITFAKDFYPDELQELINKTLED